MTVENSSDYFIAKVNKEFLQSGRGGRKKKTAHALEEVMGIRITLR